MKRIPAGIGSLVVIAAAITVGCSRDREDVGSTAAAAARQPCSETLIIPDGTNVVASLDTRLSTETSHSGDRFGATTISPIIVGGRTVVPAGARIHGVLRDVQASGRIKGRARITLIYQGIVDSADRNHAILALPLRLQAASATRGDDGIIAAGSAPSAIIGAIAGGGNGAAIETGAGAGAGTILMLATNGDEVELKAGQRLNVRTTSPTSIGVVARR